MPEIVTVPISFFELTAYYQEENIGLMLERRALVTKLFNSLRPWGIKIDDVKVLDQGKLSEQGINFKLPSQQMTFFLGGAFSHITADAASWDAAETILSIIDTYLQTLTDSAEISISHIKTVIAVHIQPKTANFLNITKQFIPLQLAQLETEHPTTVASVVVWKHRRVTIDGSGSIANGIFLRLERDFQDPGPLQQMAEQLRKDEVELFAILGIEEEGSSERL